MAAIASPLRVHPDNPRYFTHDGTRAVYLAGSHTWANLQDIGRPGDLAFPYGEYLDFMEAHHQNFMRFWMFEQPNRATPRFLGRIRPGVPNEITLSGQARPPAVGDLVFGTLSRAGDDRCMRLDEALEQAEGVRGTRQCNELIA